ncbi:hypothetical protein EW053_19805 [Streptomyces sp. IB2014 016-6]|nr:hypothetical protein EW053_19805 [Streptomyces sp. IB2014 016-6]
MTRCKKCGARKRRWPRPCSRCRAGDDTLETATDAAELAAEVGLFQWIVRGAVGVVRLLARALG